MCLALTSEAELAHHGVSAAGWLAHVHDVPRESSVLSSGWRSASAPVSKRPGASASLL